MNVRLTCLILLFLAAGPVHAQDKNKYKFGKLSKADFEPAVYSIDSNASAIVLADIGSSEFTGNDKGWFSTEYKFFRRARIINRKGYDIADVEISLYTDDGMEEQLESLKAVTYNLEDGKIVETKLDVKESVFKTRINKNLVVKKFTFPAVREGCIIEYEYKLVSDFLFNLQPWNFQGDYPVLWSDYKAIIPQFFSYVWLFQGYQKFFLNERKDRVVGFSVNDNSSNINSRVQSFSAGVSDHRWVMKDVPALKEERFTSTLRNHVSRIEFQLAEYREPLTPRNVMGTWPDAMKKLLSYEEFGQQLEKENGWLNNTISDIGGNDGTPLEKARKIYTWVRDNITNENYTSIYVRKPMRQVLKAKTGSESEINMLLVAMLRKAGLIADPVMLSTRSHGWVYAQYPLISRFNYIIARALVGRDTVLLDASNPRLGFNRLEPELYNGHARVVSENADSLFLTSDMLLEKKSTSVFLQAKENGSLSGTSEERSGYYESIALREKIIRNGNNGYLTDLQKGFGKDVSISNLVIDSLSDYDVPLVVKYQFEMKGDESDIIYLNPMFNAGMKENPFKSAVRNYPVEMPYQIDETYLLRLDIPEGYEVDELPRQLKMKLNPENEGSFEYLITSSNGSVSLRSRLILKRCYFYPEEYDSLREFFSIVVRKHNEQIVFKKKKP
ncbi:MAG: transglutaminase domain-containing protein [Chitinophagaceae bacterium]